MSSSNTLNSNPNSAGRARKTRFFSWLNLATITILSIYFFIGMEWLFWVTRPSFMDYLPITTKLGILLLPGLLLTAICLPILLVLLAAVLLPGLSKASRIILALGAALPAVFIAASTLMLIDNFTYTVLKFGIVNTTGALRGIYGLLFVILLLGTFAWAARKVWLDNARSAKRQAAALKPRLYVTAALLLLSIPLGGSLFLSDGNADAVMSAGAPSRRPNILLIGADGLDADKTSIYNAQPDTTPFLRTFAQNALLAENNFANANFTSASLVSIFSSKLPTQTRMLYPPDILRGNDAFQHLPGVLKKAGYYNAEISVDYYADPDVLNVQDGFVMVNGRSATVGRLYTFTRSYLPENTAYFVSMVAKRLSDRVFHIFYLRTMPNPYAEVRQKLSSMSDRDRMGQIISLFRDIEQPLFIHAHMMATHTNEDDVYALGVAEFDQIMRDLVTELDLMGELDQTVIIVYTDHSYGNRSGVRLPLMFRFPGGEHTRTIAANTQNLDIAPTILDYIGVQPPAWMGGQSLLQGEPPADRPIFSAAPNSRVDEDNLLQLDLAQVKPPFYQFGSINMVICHQWYALDTTALAWQSGEVAGYAAPCPAGALPDEQQARAILLDRLEQDGFDISILSPAANQ